MATKKKKSKKAPIPHPTLFVHDGSIKSYGEGTMLGLHTLITPPEWNEIVRDTIQYKVFLDCLKEVAFPILGEQWTKKDEWYRLMLEVNVSRMRQIDPIFVIQHNQDEIRKGFEAKIRNNALDIATEIKLIRESQASFDGNGDKAIIPVSDL